MVNKTKNLNTITAFSHIVICISLIISRMYGALSSVCLLLVGFIIINAVVMTMCRYKVAEKKINFYSGVVCDSLIMGLSVPAILLCVENGEMNICCFFAAGLSLLPFFKTTKRLISQVSVDVDRVDKKSQVFMKVLIVLISCYTIYGLIVEIMKDIKVI